MDSDVEPALRQDGHFPYQSERVDVRGQGTGDAFGGSHDALLSEEHHSPRPGDLRGGGRGKRGHDIFLPAEGARAGALWEMLDGRGGGRDKVWRGGGRAIVEVDAGLGASFNATKGEAARQRDGYTGGHRCEGTGASVWRRDRGLETVVNGGRGGDGHGGGAGGCLIRVLSWVVVAVGVCVVK